MTLVIGLSGIYWYAACGLPEGELMSSDATTITRYFLVQHAN